MTRQQTRLFQGLTDRKGMRGKMWSCLSIKNVFWGENRKYFGSLTKFVLKITNTQLLHVTMNLCQLLPRQWEWVCVCVCGWSEYWTHCIHVDLCVSFWFPCVCVCVGERTLDLMLAGCKRKKPLIHIDKYSVIFLTFGCWFRFTLGYRKVGVLTDKICFPFIHLPFNSTPDHNSGAHQRFRKSKWIFGVSDII